MTGPQEIVDHWPAIAAAFASEDVSITLPQALAVLPKIQAAFVVERPGVPTLDLASARIVNAPDVRSWPETSRITEVSFDGSVTRVLHTKQFGDGAWPEVVPENWKGGLQYTIWLFRQIEGQWTGSAFIQMWQDRDGSGSPRDPDIPRVYHEHWFYGTRWNPIQTAGQIADGELLGFMVSSGNGRDSRGPYGPSERSNVVVVPAADVARYRF